MTPKQKIIMLLEQDRENAEKDMKRWSASYHTYDADILFAAENNYPVNLRAVSSRALAKEELAKARETKRLYTVAINAVRRA